MSSQCLPGCCGHGCPTEGIGLHLVSPAAVLCRALPALSHAVLTSAVMALSLHNLHLL